MDLTFFPVHHWTPKVRVLHTLCTSIPTLQAILRIYGKRNHDCLLVSTVVTTSELKERLQPHAGVMGRITTKLNGDLLHT